MGVEFVDRYFIFPSIKIVVEKVFCSFVKVYLHFFYTCLGCVSLLEILIERFLNIEVISSFLCSSSLIFEDEPVSILAFNFISTFSTFALNLLNVALLASTSIAPVYISAKVLDFLSLNIKEKASPNALENLTFAIVIGGLQSTSILL